MTTPDGLGGSFARAEGISTRLGCRVVDLADVTDDIRIVRLASVSGRVLRFSAGQYASVSFGSAPARDYSMANRPDQTVLEFHVRHSHHHGASGYVARHLRLGDIAWVEGPYGDAWLRREHTGPILAAAGGSGLAPIKSIVETALALGMRQAIHLFFGARDEAGVYLEEHFARLTDRYRNLRYVTVLSDPNRPTLRPTGTVAAAVSDAFGSFDGFRAYLAGPPPMVETMTALLRRRGLADDRLHADAFYTESEQRSRGSRPLPFAAVADRG
jgi:CDP-4-dehydro-6-deoxyglucose reductase/ferredoxin-NAD(P)+ reductase (naphthalene dioxygenase ferredoxin-specific)